MLDTFKRRRVDQRSHRDISAFRRIAKLHRFHRLTQTIHKLVVNAFLHIHALCTVTHLSGVDDAGINNRFYCQIQIGVVHHDSRRFTAQLKAHFGDIFRRSRHDFFTRRHATGHADHGDFRVARQFLTDRFTAPQHQVKHTFWQANLIHNFGKGDGVIGREFARFDNDGIAGQQRGCELTGNQEERKVPRQNAGRHAQRAFKHQNIFAGAIALQDFALITTRPFRHVIDVVRGEIHFHLGQLLNFAALGDDQGTDFAGPLADPGGNFA
ncbi:hypothetical protein D3C78_1007460 [compost metagenome]